MPKTIWALEMHVFDAILESGECKKYKAGRAGKLARSPFGTFLYVPNGRSEAQQQRLTYALARHPSIQILEIAQTIEFVMLESQWR